MMAGKGLPGVSLAEEDSARSGDDATFLALPVDGIESGDFDGWCRCWAQSVQSIMTA